MISQDDFTRGYQRAREDIESGREPMSLLGYSAIFKDGYYQAIFDLKP